ncbi:S1C family serine protease [Peptoniphilus mikwangii]|uniref:S1C family serine protease n=1 Tax=Peptoniphilus mikwangii TaxID=1354300 RepID=UPI000415AF35|nr:trypsin-like peptidase domain-containing protein [Peptoniphilus mikwangii]
MENETLYQEQKYEYNYENENNRRRKKKSNKSVIVLAIVFSLIGGIVGSSITYALFGEKMSSETNLASANGNNAVTISTKGEVNVAQAVAQKAIPSVVGITTKGQVNSMFGAVEAKGTGSGIIVDERGYILTNAHVVKVGSQVVDTATVLLDDGTTLEGKPIWVDSNIDIAIVKIEPKGKLTAATLGDSSTLQIGQTAIAIGNPIDIAYQRSVTQGIISGLNRYVGQVNGGGYMTGLIQTDASINGGNSGGPLLNEKGEVIGINTVKVNSAEGLGFSIPINTVKPIIEQVINTGTYNIVFMGIENPVNAVDVQRYLNKDLGVDKGVFVFAVRENSPAKQAGIEAGDVITKIGDTEIENESSLRVALYKYKVGDREKITIVRDGKEKQVEIEFGEYLKDTESIEGK